MRDEFSSVPPTMISLRDLTAPLVRQRNTVATVFLLILCVAALAAWTAPPEYKSEMTLLVSRDRAETIVSPDAETGSVRPDLNESELMSEAEMIRSRDLLEQVALDVGLHVPAEFPDPVEEARERAAAVARLRGSLEVEPIRRTTLIYVAYTARDPQVAAKVLQRLSQRYLDKHLAVHRPAGTHEFFSEQVTRAREELSRAEQKLSEFGQREGVVLPEQERTTVLEQLSSFESLQQQARAEMADADRRLSAVQTELKTTPGRQVTAIRTGANAGLISDLKAKVLEMELQREELLRKFTPQYQPVVQLESQLAHAREALAEVEKQPMLDQTTDQNPTHQWLRNEEARIRAERAALGARVGSLGRSVAEYRDRARRLDGATIEQQELLRTAKAAEDSFLLYQRREEEARIADALDATRIANVRVSDAPTVPQGQSASQAALFLWVGFVAAALLSVATAYALDWLHPVIYSSRDVQSTLDVPVLAAVQASTD